MREGVVRGLEGGVFGVQLLALDQLCGGAVVQVLQVVELSRQLGVAATNLKATGCGLVLCHSASVSVHLFVSLQLCFALTLSHSVSLCVSLCDSV